MNLLFLKKHRRKIRIAKYIVGGLLGVMILIDIVLVMLEKYDWPTFSWVIRDNRPTSLWLTFLVGGLVAKVFYNRKVYLKGKEASGFFAFVCVVAMLMVLGYAIPAVDFMDELIVLLCGGVIAYRIWPQYESVERATEKQVEKEALMVLQQKIASDQAAQKQHLEAE